MKGNPQVIADLQSGYAREVNLHEQMRLDSRCLKFMGLDKVACKVKGLAGDVHYFRKCIVDRLLFLEGDPSASIGSVKQQSDLTALLQNELAMTMAIVSPYEDAVATATAAKDDTTRNLFEHLLKWHEEHVCWLEKQLRLIDQLGVEEYSAEKL